jgi:hypothetical protein
MRIYVLFITSISLLLSPSVPLSCTNSQCELKPNQSASKKKSTREKEERKRNKKETSQPIDQVPAIP